MLRVRPFGSLLLLAAATACHGLEATAPRVLAVNPNVICEGGAPVPLQITGDNLTPLTLADAGGTPSLHLPTLALVNAADGNVVPLGDVNWINNETMTATLPANLANGGYAVRATNPGGEATQSPPLLYVQGAPALGLDANATPLVQAVSPNNLCMADSTTLHVSGKNLLMDGAQTPQLLVLSGETLVATGVGTQMTGCAAAADNVQMCTGMTTTLQMNSNDVVADTYTFQVKNPVSGCLSVAVPLNLTLAPAITAPAANGTVHLCTGGGGNFEIQGSNLQSMTDVALGGVPAELVQGMGCTGTSCPALRVTFGAAATAQTGNVPLTLSNGGLCNQSVDTNVVVTPGFTITSITPNRASEALDASLVVQLDAMAGADVVNTIALEASNGVPVFVCGTATTPACAALLPIATDATGDTVAVNVPAAVLQSFVNPSGPPPTVGIEVQLQQSGCGAFLANALTIQK